MSHRALGDQFKGQGTLFPGGRYKVGPTQHPEKPEKVYGKRAGFLQGSMIRVWGDARPPEVREDAMANPNRGKHYTGHPK